MLNPDLSAPPVVPAPAPFAYRPVEETYTIPMGAWTATCGVRRFADGEVMATLTAPDDPALERFANGVTIYFDAAGRVTDAYGYGVGKMKNRQLKLPNRRGTAIYHEQAAQMRERLLAEPVRSLPVLTRTEVPGEPDTARLLLLAGTDEPTGPRCRLISVLLAQPTDVIDWRGYSLEEALEQATPTRQDFVREFYDPTARDVYDRLVLAPQREAQRVDELTAQACAHIADLPLDIKKMLRRLSRSHSVAWHDLDTENEADMDTARRIEANGWGHIGSTPNRFLSPGGERLTATQAGERVIRALAGADAREHARRPFEHEGFESTCRSSLTPEDWRALFDRPQVPLVRQTRPMYGGTTAEYEAWLAALPAPQAKVAAAYRRAVLAAARVQLPTEQMMGAIKAAITEWVDQRMDEVQTIRGETTDLARHALMGIEDDLSGETRSSFPPLRPWSKIKKFPGGLAPVKPSPRQQAALEWPCEAEEDFAAWLGRMAAQPPAVSVDTPETVTETSGVWYDWAGRQESILAVLAYLERATVQTPDGLPFNARAWLEEIGWSWTAESVREVCEAAGFLQAHRRYPHGERPDLMPLTAGESALYRAMAGQAIGQALGLDSAGYWDRFRVPPFSGQPEIALDTPRDEEPGPETAGEPPAEPEPVLMTRAAPRPGLDALGLYLAGREPMKAWIEDRAAFLLEADPHLSEVQARILAGGDLAAQIQEQWAGLSGRVEALLGTPDRMDPRDRERYDAVQELTEIQRAPKPNEIIADLTGDRAILATAEYMRAHRADFKALARRPQPPAPPQAATWTLRSNGFGLLELKDGGVPCTLTWLGGDDLSGDPRAVECARRLFSKDLQRRRPTRVWTATATETAAAGCR